MWTRLYSKSKIHYTQDNNYFEDDFNHRNILSKMKIHFRLLFRLKIDAQQYSCRYFFLFFFKTKIKIFYTDVET